MKNYLVILLLLILMIFLFGCSIKENEKTPLTEMIGQTYSNCQVKSIVKRQDETVLTCIYDNELMVIDTYTAEYTDNQIRDEFIEILASNDAYWNIMTE